MSRGPALLLAAGRATRLQGLREHYAKACVPVGDTTPLAHLLPRVLAGGWAPVWLNLHHHGEQVRDAALALAAACGAADRLRFLEEPELLGTGGTLRAVTEAGGALPTLVANVKVLTDFDLGLLAGAAPGTVVLHAGSPLATFGGFRYDPEARLVLGLQPRDVPIPEGEAAAPYTGFCRPHPAWLDHLRQSDAALPCLVRQGLLPALADGIPAPVLLHDGLWHEVSTPDRLEAAARAQRKLATKSVPFSTGSP